MEANSLPPLVGGVYLLPDGREFVALDDFEVAALARESFRRQYIADTYLEMQLAKNPRRGDDVRPVASQIPTRLQLEIF